MSTVKQTRIKKEGHTPFLIRNMPNDIHARARAAARQAGVPMTVWVMRAMEHLLEAGDAEEHF